MKLRKRIMAVAVAFSMMLGSLSCLPDSEYSLFHSSIIADAAEIGSGSCGENLTWVLDSNGVLTISGTGDMTDYEGDYDYPPWIYYRDSITKVIINHGVTSIGSIAFYMCQSLESIVIPDSVTSIGYWAFSDCSSLSNITIPDSVTSIDFCAFSNCNNLSSITIPDNITSISDSAFDCCRNLVSVSIPNSVTSIGGCAFYGCTSLANITIPNSVTSIGREAFVNTPWLEAKQAENPFVVVNNILIDGRKASIGNVTIPSNVRSIGARAFYECSKLESITIPNSVISIGDDAFYNCNKLESITIPNSVISIGKYAFYETAWLKAKKAENPLVVVNNILIDGRTASGNVTIPNNVTSIAPNAFDSSGIESLIIPNSVTSIGDDAISWCQNLKNVNIPDSITSINSNTFIGCYNLTSITIPNSVNTIGGGAFRECTNLASITLPNNLISIGSAAFRECRNLASISIPKCVTSIGKRAFYGCTSLKSITIPNTVTSIGKCALGYYLKSDLPDQKIENFKLYCYKNTVGEQYAINNGFDYELIKDLISNCTITFSSTSYTYDGTEKKPTVTVKNGSTTLTNGTDYTLSYSNNTNAGTGKVTITGKGNYTGSVTKTFTINAKSISGTSVTLSQTSYTYDGTEKKPSVTVKDGTKTLTNGTDYTITYSNNKNVGTAKATVTGKGNYSGTVSKSFTITEAPNTDISKCTITLGTSTYTYDGTAKKPSVTVKNGSTTLTNGTDYTLSYSNNTNAGTGKVTISGKGKYTGSVTKTFTINAKSISGTSVTLSQTSYTYDGTAKKPTVTVKDGSKTLTSGTDYTVSYSNNTNVGTATVTVTGKGNYTGTKSTTFIIINTIIFEWGRDNWNFNNSSYYFKWGYKVNDSVMLQMKNDFNLSDTDIYELKNEMNTSSTFCGSCFGMTISEILASQGDLDLTRYGGNKVVNKNKNDTNMTSVINFIQLLQLNSHFCQSIRQTPFLSGEYSQEKFISKLSSVVSEKTNLVKVSYMIAVINPKTGKRNEGYHAVLAYGQENCNYYSSITGKTYNKRILIADPNYLTGNKLNTEACLYYNSSDKSWIVPYWNTSLNNGYKQYCYWNAGTGTGYGKIRNIMRYDSLGEYVDLMAEFTSDQYIAGLTINNVSNNPSLVDQVANTGNPTSDYAGSFASGGIARYDSEFADELYLPNNTEMFALWNPTAQYTLSYNVPSEFSLKMDYEMIDYYVDAKNVTYSLFKPSGYYALRGSDADYSITMVTDKKACVTDWYALTVEGKDVDSVSLKRVSGGYVLQGNQLNNVKVTAENNNVKPTVSFSTKYDSAFIYEVDKNTIGIKVDTDNNGTYETVLNTTAPQNPTISYEKGDGAVILTWTKVSGAEQYAIYGYVDGKWKSIAQGNGTSYILKGLTAGKQYKVVVIAKINGVWNTKDVSHAITVTPNAPTAKYPVVSSEVKGSQFRLTWTAVPNAQGYAVAVYQNGWKLLKQTSATTLTYTSSKLSPGTYHIAVVAKIGGKWDTTDIKSRVVTITIK